MKKKALCILAAVVLCFVLPWPASANSAEPPCLTVLVPAPPEDLELTIEFDAAQDRDPQRLSPEWMAWEGYYRFFGRWDTDPEGLTGAKLLVGTEGESFALEIDPKGFSKYNNILTLDLKARTLTYGQPWWRQPLLVFVRVTLTLLIEGGIFWLFRYRQRRSWIVFLAANLVTQLGVNLTLLAVCPAVLDSYMAMVTGFFVYTPMEVLVLLIEMIAFAKLLREHSKRRAAGVAFLANLLSWALGGLLLLILPI